MQKSSTQARRRNFFKFFLIVLLILLIGLIGCYFVFQQGIAGVGADRPLPVQVSATTGPYANKLYENSDYVFSYPENFDVWEDKDHSYISYVETPHYKPLTNESYHIQITTAKGNLFFTPQDFLRKERATTVGGDKFLRYEETKINGTNAIIIYYKNGWEIYKTYFVYSGAKAVLLKGTGSANGDNHEILDTLVSSFHLK